jgi:8-oxo-dGTP pyrophosphatase MutT (NUDIX family)
MKGSSNQPGPAPAGPRSAVIRVFDCHVARATDNGRYEYLLLRRASHKIYANSWRMVGGKLHADETAWQACLRELAEETRLSPSRLLSVPYVNRFYEWQQDRINDIPVFVAVVAPGVDPVLDEEHTDFVWLDLKAALERLPWPGQRQGVEAANELLLHGELLQNFLEVDLAGTASA